MKEEMKKKISHIKACVEFYSSSSWDSEYGYVVDTDVKVDDLTCIFREELEEEKSHKIRVLTVVPTGGRYDESRLEVLHQSKMEFSSIADFNQHIKQVFKTMSDAGFPIEYEIERVLWSNVD